jgi:hypothetical protein
MSGQWRAVDASNGAAHVRLCTRILMSHHFSELGRDTLVSATSFTYQNTSQAGSTHSVYSFLTKAWRSGFQRAPQEAVVGYMYVTARMPAVEFELRACHLGPRQAHWCDQAAFWSAVPSRADAQRCPVDLQSNGRPSKLCSSARAHGIQMSDEGGGWSPFLPFQTTINRLINELSVRQLELDRESLPDAALSDGSLWYRSLGEGGFRFAGSIPQLHDEERGLPHACFEAADESIILADFTGDGLSGVVRLTNTEVCYWPNLGHGQFGAKVALDNCPFLDSDERFNHKRALLADIDGSGPVALVYFHPTGVRLYINECGNLWTDPIPLNVFTSPTNTASVSAIDLFGNRTTCLLAATPLALLSPAVQYVNLMGSIKPHLLTRTNNNMGVSTEISYSTSAGFYLQDDLAEKGWNTKLPFPVHLVKTISTRDEVSRNVFTKRFAYHQHSFFGIGEREFQGISMVEQWDYNDMAAVTGHEHVPGTSAPARS